MESPRLDVISEGAELIITKQTIQIIRTSSRYDYEVYQLRNVTGFGFFERPGPAVPVARGNSGLWLLGFLVFGGIAYFLRGNGPFSAEFLVPALFAFLCVMIVADIENQPLMMQPTVEYGLRISLNSGEDKLLLNQNKLQIKDAVERIYEFMQHGAAISQLVVQNTYYRMNTIVESYYQDSVVQRSSAGNYAGDRISGNKIVY